MSPDARDIAPAQPSEHRQHDPETHHDPQRMQPGCRRTRRFSEHPDQKALLLEDLSGRAEACAEEVLRYATPVMHFRRTAIVDTEIRGVPINAGEAVVMWYCSGNYDENAFEPEYRAVLSALAASGRVLEVNTKSPMASVGLVRWWREAGGRAVSFGSDAHQPWRVGDKFKTAVDVVEAAGFRAGRDRFDFWRL